MGLYIRVVYTCLYNFLKTPRRNTLPDAVFNADHDKNIKIYIF